MNPVVQARGLRKTYIQAGTRIEVLRGLELAVFPAQTVAILGESGSGKSTLLSLLAGLDSATEGSVQIEGRELGDLSESELSGLRARSVGIVFQQFHLMTYLNALENVALPLEILGRPDAETRARRALESVGLSDRLSHLPSQLSGGEKQRVAIARAQVSSPRLLLADEPSGSLDTRTGAEVMELLFEQVHRSAMALILVTHNEALAARCDRILRLQNGVLAEPRS